MSERDAAESIKEVLRELAGVVGGEGRGEGERLFFPAGIDHIDIRVKVGSTEMALVVSGAKSKPVSAIESFAHDEVFASTEMPGITTVQRRSTAFVQLPQGTSDYNTYADPERQYGTQEMIDTIKAVADTVHKTDAKLTFSVGDISFEDGSEMPPHKAHRLGRNADHRPIRKDRKDKPVVYTSSDYDREATKIVIDAYLAHKNVRKVIFNDTSITGVTPDPAGTHTHDNHFHVETKA